MGHPQRIRYDEEGTHISTELGEMMPEAGVVLGHVPAHAHWQNGNAEMRIRTISEGIGEVMTDVRVSREESEHLMSGAYNRAACR